MADQLSTRRISARLAASRLPSHKAPIFRLPPEILLLIMDEVEGLEEECGLIVPRRLENITAIKILRLVCQKFSSLASPRLVRIISVDVRHSSMRELEAISRHLVISTGVRAIRVCIDGNRVCHPGGSFGFFRTEQDKAQKRAGVDWHSWPLAEHLRRLDGVHSACMANFKKQLVLTADGENLAELIATCIARMPHALELKFTDAYFHNSDSSGLYYLENCHQGRRRDWEFPFDVRRPLPNLNGPSSVYRLEFANAIYKRILDPDLSHSTFDDASPMYGLILTLPTALYKRNVSVKAVDVGLRRPEYLHNAGRSSRTLDELSAATSQVRSFRFALPSRLSFDEWVTVESIQQCFVRPSALRALRLDAQPGTLSTRHEGFIGSYPFTRTPYPTLRDIVLHGIYVIVDDLLRLLSGLPSDIDSLKIEHVSLYYGSWARVLDALRAKSFHRVSFCQLISNTSEGRGSIHRDFDWTRAEAFVLGHTGFNPVRAVETRCED